MCSKVSISTLVLRELGDRAGTNLVTDAHQVRTPGEQMRLLPSRGCGLRIDPRRRAGSPARAMTSPRATSTSSANVRVTASPARASDKSPSAGDDARDGGLLSARRLRRHGRPDGPCRRPRCRRIHGSRRLGRLTHSTGNRSGFILEALLYIEGSRDVPAVWDRRTRDIPIGGAPRRCPRTEPIQG